VNIANRLEVQPRRAKVLLFSGMVREAVAGRLKAPFVDFGGLTLGNKSTSLMLSAA
jgi:hypothetical protein